MLVSRSPTFTGKLYPGTYQVSVRKLGKNNLPDWTTVVVERLQIP